MEGLVGEALGNRPELSAAKLNQSASEHFADAEKRLRYPSVSAVGAVGAIPVHQRNLSNQYGAAGVNVSIPFLNGGLYAARRDEAEYRARQAEKESEVIALQVAAGVRVAWIEADNAWRDWTSPPNSWIRLLRPCGSRRRDTRSVSAEFSNSPSLNSP